MENLKEYEEKLKKYEEKIFSLEKKYRQLELENEENLRDLEISRISSLENFENKQALIRKEIELSTFREQLLNKDIAIEELTREHNNSIKDHLEEISVLKVI